jgi:2-phosphosulfolactate phosphatase
MISTVLAFGAMKIEHLSLHRLSRERAAYDVVVVIDVLRSFTTAACAFESGARTIFPVDGAGEAFALWRRRPHALLVGALPGGRPIPGFDAPNSPSALARRDDLRNRDLILSTAAGVRGLFRLADSGAVFAAALVNVGATADAIRSLGPANVALLSTGEWVDRDGDEDRACADLIEARLRGFATTPAHFEARVRQSDFGRQFGHADRPHLPAADLELAARVDAHPFAMPVVRDRTGRLTIGASPT